MDPARAAQTLKHMLSDHREGLLKGGADADALFSDYFPQEPAAASVLLQALRQGVVRRLREDLNTVPASALRTSLEQSLRRRYLVDSDAARFAISSWAKALDIDLGPVETSPPPAATPAPSSPSIRKDRLAVYGGIALLFSVLAIGGIWFFLIRGPSADELVARGLAAYHRNDMAEAEHNFSAAAQEGSAEGAFYLSSLYLGTPGIPGKVPEGIALLRKSAEQDYGPAQLQLGYIYLRGLPDLARDPSAAFQWVGMAADHHHIAEAEFQLGQLWYSGTGVKEKDADKAAEYFARAAAQNFAPAELALADLYRSGDGIPRDPSKAAQLYQQAAEQGWPEAYVSLGVLYERGMGLPRDPSKAAYLYRQASAVSRQANGADYAPALIALGGLYETGNGVGKKDLDQAIKLYHEAAAQGLPDAFVRLAYLYGNGFGVPKDVSKAADLYRQANDISRQANGMDFPPALVGLGFLYETGEGVGKKDLAKALTLYQQAATRGIPEAYFNLGRLYRGGLGVGHDSSKAADLFRQASNEDYAPAHVALGLLYENGDGLPKDPRIAVRLYQRAADQEWPEGTYNLGRAYQFSIGVGKDSMKAAAYYRQASDQAGELGFAPALNALAILYETGEGVTKNLATAESLYLRAAAFGVAVADYNVGRFYEFGLTGEKDATQAAFHYRQARDHGYNDAASALSRVCRSIPDDAWKRPGDSFSSTVARIAQPCEGVR